MANPQDVLDFWFHEIDSKKWWVKDPDFDLLIKDRFGDCHHSATLGELFHWRSRPEGRLAEIIVLDQFSRNIYRNDPRSFAFDGMALLLAQECVDRGLNREIKVSQRSFLYLPFMHSESRSIHEVAVRLFSEPGLENNLEFELKHKVIIDRFGRYPHRNQVLGRESTPEELEFLQQPNSSF